MKLKKRKIIIVATVSLLFIILLPFVQAQAAGLVGCTDNCSLWDLVLVVVRLINFLLAISGLVAMIFIVWGGWGMITAAGNEEKITTGKATLSNAVIGFFLILVAWVLIDAIVNILAGGSLRLNDFFQFIKPGH